MSFPTYLQQAADAYGLTLSDKQQQQFQRYFELLLEWNQHINLTAITAPQDVAVKHMIDSLSCFHTDYIKPGDTMIDVGTGAGFPGLPLKIFYPQAKLILLDSLQKRLKFLDTVVQELALTDVTLVHARAEEAGQQASHRGQYQIALSRAVARLNVLVELCLPFVRPGGYFIALKGAQYQEEIAESQKALSVLGGKLVEVRPVKLPGLDDKRAVIYIKKVSATPKAYPRRPGLPEKKPL